MISLSELSNLTQSGVYCLINDSTKKVYVGYGFNVLNSLQRILTQFSLKSLSNTTLQTELPECTFNLIETLPSPSSFVLKDRASYWIRYYKSKGYSVMNNRMPINLSIITYIQSECIYVVLRSNNRKEHVLGRFKSNSSAQEFISKYKIDNTLT